MNARYLDFKIGVFMTNVFELLFHNYAVFNVKNWDEIQGQMTEDENH